MRRIGALRFTILAFGVSFALSMVNFDKVYAWEFGWNAWIIGLPTWLLGCLLAEKIRTGLFTSVHNSVLLWRVGGALISTGALLLVFHSPVRVGYNITLNLFAIYAFFWIRAELIRYTKRGPWRIFEWMGIWSYSLYLIHNMVIAGLKAQHLIVNPILFWGLQVTAIMGTSYLFYLVIEMPSHLLARYWGNRLRLRKSASLL